MTNSAWHWRPLGDLFDIGAGKTMSAAARLGPEKVPFLRTSNVLWDEIDLSEIDEMSMSKSDLASKSLKAGDLLVCEGGEIGRAAVWDGQVDMMSFQNHLHRLRAKRDDVDAKFYVYFLQSAFTQLGIFEGAGNKTTIPNISRSRLAALEVPHPSMDEQVMISGVLMKVREVLTLAGKAASIAHELKRAALNELFTCGLHGGLQKETEIGLVPDGWDVVAIGDVAVRTQYGLSVRGQARGEFPILRMNCQEDGCVVFRDLQFVDLDKESFDAFRLEVGDLLFNRTNSIEHVGRTAIFEDEREAVFASYLVRLSIDQKRCLPRFLNYYMNRSEVQADIKRLASRAVGQANINASKLRTVLFPLPPCLKQQREVVEVLDAIDKKITVLRRKREVLEELFKSLLHKLMVGEVRVADLNLSVLKV